MRTIEKEQVSTRATDSSEGTGAFSTTSSKPLEPEYNIRSKAGTEALEGDQSKLTMAIQKQQQTTRRESEQLERASSSERVADYISCEKSCFVARAWTF